MPRICISKFGITSRSECGEKVFLKLTRIGLIRQNSFANIVVLKKSGVPSPCPLELTANTVVIQGSNFFHIMKQKAKLAFTVVLIIVALYLKFKEGRDQNTAAPRDGSITAASEGEFEGKFTPVKTSGGDWELLKNCQFVTGLNSDGDSFHIKHADGKDEFRLYFIDTPESQYREYRNGDTNGPRLKEQGDYFGGLDQKQTTQLGTEGKEFTKRLLLKGDFKIITKWEPVARDHRRHCFVIVPWEGREVYLHELMVAQGLGRIHTRGAGLPQGRSWKEQRNYLESWEKEVKAKGIGGWGM